MVDPEKMLVERGVACAKLGDDGGLAAVEVSDKFEVFLRREGAINCVESGIMRGGFPTSLPASLDEGEVLLV